jgi:hypothetical protein
MNPSDRADPRIQCNVRASVWIGCPAGARRDDGKDARKRALTRAVFLPIVLWGVASRGAATGCALIRREQGNALSLE